MTLSSLQEKNWHDLLNPEEKEKKIRTLPIQDILWVLPDFFDLLALGLSGGFSLLQAWEEAAQLLPDGPLRRQLRQVAEQVRAGVTWRYVLERLRSQIPWESLQLFFCILIQSVQTGHRLQDHFHDQANILRAEAMRRVEKRVQTAPIRMLLPLFIFIFPTLFLILFTPIFIQLSQGGPLF